jgi:Tfp pilus assembly PilM family ATPase
MPGVLDIVARHVSAGARRNIGWIGVDVGSTAIKAAQVERHKTGWRLLHHVILPLAGRSGGAWLESGPPPLDRAMLAGFQGRRAAGVLPMSLAELRYLEVPPGTEEETRGMIAQDFASQAQDADGELPEFGFWRLDNSAEARGGLTRLGVIAVRPAHGAAVANRLLPGGWRCQVLDGLPFVLARAVEMALPSASSRPQAVLDWGYTSPMFAIVQHGQPTYVRLLANCGLKELHQAMCDELSLAPHECQCLLSKYGLPVAQAPSKTRDLQVAIGHASSAPLARLIEELRKTLSYVRARHASLLPERLWLLGGGAAIANVASPMKAGVDMPCHIWKLPPDHTNDVSRAEDAPLLSAAIALSALGAPA